MSWRVTFYLNHIAMDNEYLPIIVTGPEEYYPVFFDSVRSRGGVIRPVAQPSPRFRPPAKARLTGKGKLALPGSHRGHDREISPTLLPCGVRGMLPVGDDLEEFMARGATHIGRSTPSGSPKPFTFCTVPRRSPRPGSARRGTTSNGSTTA